MSFQQSTPIKVFVSFARECKPWKDTFVDPEWFQQPLRAMLDDYRENPVSVGRIDQNLIDRIYDCDCFLALLSSEYTLKDYTQLEFDAALHRFNPARRDRPGVLACVVLDEIGRSWWDERTNTEAGAWLKPLAYLEMVHATGARPVDIVGPNGPIISVTEKVRGFALSIRKELLSSRTSGEFSSVRPGPLPTEAIASPGPPKRCLGREPEINEIERELMSGAPRPIPILGEPGVGKGTVMLAALDRPHVAGRYPRRYFVHCDGAPNAEGIRHRIATAVGAVGAVAATPPALATLRMPAAAPNTRNSQLMMAIVRALEAAKPAVIALDDVDEAWHEDRRETETVLARIAGIKDVVLLTAVRGRQRPAGPRWREPIELKPLNDHWPHDLFLEIAGTRFAHDRLLPAILEELGGLPLLIELMAHAAEAESDLEEIWTRWSRDHLGVIDRSQGKPDRTSDAQTSFELSIKSRAMTKEALRLLSILAMLPVGLAKADLEPLLQSAGLDGAATLRRLALAFEEAGRLRVRAPLRAYVAAKYPVSDDDVRIVAEHYCGFMSDLPWTPKSRRAVRRTTMLAQEAPNAGAILRSQLRRRPVPAALEPALVRLANRTANHVFLLGLNLVGKRYLDDALKAAEAQGDEEGVATTCLNLGRIEEKLGAYDDAEKHLRVACKPIGSPDDHARACSAAHILGITAFNRCHYDDAIKELQQGLALLPFLEVDGKSREEAKYLRCDLLERLCVTYVVTAEYDKAETYGSEGLQLARDLQDDFRISVHLKNLCWLAIENKDLDTAEKRGREGLAMARALGHPGEMAGLCQLLARCAARRNRIEEAKEILREGRRHALAARHKWYMASIWNEWGELHLGASPEKAAKGFKKARQIAHDIGSPDLEARSLFGLARVPGAKDGAEMAQKSLALYRAIGLRHKTHEVGQWVQTFHKRSSGT
ncbi:MAG TPA: toll/interleukin-1 receptor domain-containing protein [Beijerinckiaceae bacterium]|jgi:tetratricopeptide (TPR) repeat protein